MAETQQIEMQPQPTEAQPALQTNKKSSGGKIVLIGCIVLLILSLLCCGIFGGITYFAVNAGLKAMKEEASKVLCTDSQSKASELYTNNTTADFRSRVTETEFTEMITTISNDGCDEFKNAGFIDAIKKGWSVQTETVNGVNTYNFDGKLGEKKVKLRMMTEDGELKIDNLEVL